MNAFASHYFWIPLIAVVLLLFVVPAVRGRIARPRVKRVPPSFLDRMDVEAAGRRAMEKTFPPQVGICLGCGKPIRKGMLYCLACTEPL